MRFLLRFLREEDGPTAVEYAVMLALIVIACMAGVQALTQETANSFNRSGAAIDSALNGGSVNWRALGTARQVGRVCWLELTRADRAGLRGAQ